MMTDRPPTPPPPPPPPPPLFFFFFPPHPPTPSPPPHLPHPTPPTPPPDGGVWLTPSLQRPPTRRRNPTRRPGWTRRWPSGGRRRPQGFCVFVFFGVFWGWRMTKEVAAATRRRAVTDVLRLPRRSSHVRRRSRAQRPRTSRSKPPTTVTLSAIVTVDGCRVRPTAKSPTARGPIRQVVNLLARGRSVAR